MRRIYTAGRHSEPALRFGRTRAIVLLVALMVASPSLATRRLTQHERETQLKHLARFSKDIERAMQENLGANVAVRLPSERSVQLGTINTQGPTLLPLGKTLQGANPAHILQVSLVERLQGDPKQIELIDHKKRIRVFSQKSELVFAGTEMKPPRPPLISYWRDPDPSHPVFRITINKNPMDVVAVFLPGREVGGRFISRQAGLIPLDEASQFTNEDDVRLYLEALSP